MKKIPALLFSIFLLNFGLANADAGTAIEDSAITAAVKAKMATNSIISALDIKIETTKGVVKLEGNIKTTAEADTAVEIASSTEGVSDVDTSHLHVQGSNQPLRDSFITAKIKGIYIKEKIFSDKDIALTNIHVETNEGIVYLKGEATREQADNAERLAKLVKGVKNVKSGLRIKG